MPFSVMNIYHDTPYMQNKRFPTEFSTLSREQMKTEYTDEGDSEM